MYCSKCGKEVTGGKFCKYCGESIIMKPIEQSQSAERPNNNIKKPPSGTPELQSRSTASQSMQNPVVHTTNSSQNQKNGSPGALILGILSIVLGVLFPIGGCVAGIVAIVVGSIAIKKGAKGSAIGGLVCGIIGLILSLIIWLFSFLLLILL